MKKFAFIPLVVLTVAGACSDATSNPLALDGGLAEAKAGPQVKPQSGGGSVSNQTTVLATFETTIAGGYSIATSGPGINEEGKELGTCHAGGEWQNPSGNFAQEVPHSHCIRGGEERTVRWSFSAPATFVSNANNTLLNFQDLVDHTVHYLGGPDRTDGQGVLGASLDGGEWSLDLDQFTRDGNAFAACGTNCLDAKAVFTYDGVEYEAEAKLTW